MSFSNSVTRRYTPPTCTLEISAKDSPLTRWMGRSALKHLRFKLSFDDPRVSDDRWITVRGDRSQLESLSQVVTTYVQQFLNQSTTLLNATHSENGTAPDLSSSATASPLSVMSRPTPQDAVETNPARISIQPSGILSHELFLGTLATEESGASIRLSAVQLADLASALDEYATDVTALPSLNRPAWSKSPQWTSIAATALIAFGLGASVLKLFDRPSQPQNTTTSSQGASSSDQRLAIQPLPSSPSPSPSALLPTAPPPLISLNPPAPPTSPAPSTTGNLPKITVLPAPPANSVPVEAPPGLTIQPVPSGERAYPVSPVPKASAGSAKRSAQAPSAASQSAGEERAAISSSNTNPSAESSRAAESSPSLDKDSTAFDKIPQVAEVRQFFQKRWQPRPELTEKLQYSITLNADGSIRRTDALNQAAGDYIDRTGMPPWGEPFVSPLKGRNSAVIRVVLSSDGTVQTFLQAGSGQ